MTDERDVEDALSSARGARDAWERQYGVLLAEVVSLREEVVSLTQQRDELVTENRLLRDDETEGKRRRIAIENENQQLRAQVVSLTAERDRLQDLALNNLGAMNRQKERAEAAEAEVTRLRQVLAQQPYETEMELAEEVTRLRTAIEARGHWPYCASRAVGDHPCDCFMSVLDGVPTTQQEGDQR